MVPKAALVLAPVAKLRFKGRVRVAGIEVVKSVERLSLEFHLHLFSDADVLLQRQGRY